ncbi:hypothetical protein EDD36DRAFT_482381 [Exophiala viscosa]|uniref:FAD dependent oxidoreductase domain-containing protein n=1 Tax=Exophiala viscosa TaxID=2486360 RepID=A0AAN6I9J1_9EURO|nr:hypothetical protein EDD36DRAFT_482381 [Exophiala viscosa]
MSSSKQDQSIFDTLAARLDKDPGTPVNDPTESFWQVPRLPIADARSEQLPEVADVVVIGSGITGISTSLHLLRQDHSLKIVMLEARSAISGATGRNGGHIKAVPWADYYALKEEFGKESAMKITKFRLSHLDALVGEADALGEAGKVGLVRRVEGVSGVYDEEGWKLAKVKLQSFLEDFPEERGRWTICEDQAELNQLGLANAYGFIPRNANSWAGGSLHSVYKSPVRSAYVERADIYQARYPLHQRIHCTLAAGLEREMWPLRGQMTVQSVPEAFPRVGGTRSWSAIWARGFDYITQSPAEDGSLYLGGGFLQGGLEKDQDLGSTDDSTLSAQCLEHLEAVPSKAFVHGTGAKVEKKWTGIMGFTGDGLPMVDRVRSHVSGREECEPNVGGEWIAAGWDGYGMVHCWLAGKALAAMVTGHEDEVRDWFPKDEFACSKERLDKMSAEGALERFFGSLTSENKR